MNHQDKLRPLETNQNILNPIIIQDVFTPQECQDIISKTKGKGFFQATLENKVINADIRETNIKYLNLDNDNVWIAQKIVPIITSINKNIYKFNLTNIKELHLLEYQEGYFYDWHLDIHGKYNDELRKLSFVVFLTNENEYQGGNLDFEIKRKEHTGHLPMKQGSIAIFPSFVLHKVTPVTKGVRYSLVGWVYGPPFQ